MDVDDDDEYMNAAAAHAAFVITVSAATASNASMYWLLRHAQHTRDINIHKLHPLPDKIGLGSADFLHSGTGYIHRNSRVRSIRPIDFSQFKSEFFRTRAKIFIHDFNHENRKIGIVELKRPCFSMPISVTIFCSVEHPFYKAASPYYVRTL